VRGNKRAVQAAKKAQIPIKGMVNPPKEDNSRMAPWREGQLFPDGWETMSVPEKVMQHHLCVWTTESPPYVIRTRRVAPGGAKGLYLCKFRLQHNVKE
jgi:hypothetical protein